jgi:hypothetical protein
LGKYSSLGASCRPRNTPPHLACSRADGAHLALFRSKHDARRGRCWARSAPVRTQPHHLPQQAPRRALPDCPSLGNLHPLSSDGACDNARGRCLPTHFLARFLWAFAASKKSRCKKVVL